MKARNRVLLGAAGLAAAAALVAVGVAAWLNLKLDTAPATLGPLPVSLIPPDPELPLIVGQPIEVGAVASTAYPLASLELWADGELVDISQTTSPQLGWAPMALFSWTPNHPGPFMLVAVAREPDGQTHSSAPLQLDVIASSLPLTEAASEPPPAVSVAHGGRGEAPVGELPGSPPGGSSGSQPSAPPAEIPPAQPWTPNAINLLQRLGSLATRSYTHPELQVAVSGCQVELLIHQQDTHGFELQLKRVSATESFSQDILATVNMPSGQDWISYVDSDPPAGTSQYQASLLTPDGAYSSSPVLVELPAADCPDPWQQGNALGLQLLYGDSGPAAERAYCYVGESPAAYSRWPEVGFLEPVSGGYGNAGEIAQLAFDPDRLTGEEFHIECWGWAGDDLISLAEYRGAMDDLTDPGQTPMPAQAENFEISELGLHPGIVSPLMDSLFAARMPYLHAELTFDPEICGAHLPPDAQNALGKLLFCTPYPIYDVGEQPYLVWTALEGQCPLGQNCLTAEEVMALAEDNGAKVGFGVYSADHPQVPFAKTDIQRSMHLVAPSNPKWYCGIQRGYTVRMYYEGAPYGDDLPWNTALGPSSNTVSIPFDCPAPEGVLIEVNFNRIKFGQVSDGDNGPEVLEAYGSLRAGTTITDSLTNRLLISEWGAPYGDCSGDYDNWSITHEALCPQVIGKSYNWNLDYNFTWPMCRSTNLQCPGFDWYDNHRSLLVHVEDGDALSVGIAMYDYDALSHNDKVCFVGVWTPEFSSTEWAKHDGEQWWMGMGDNGHAWCKVYFSTTAKEVYY